VLELSDAEEDEQERKPGLHNIRNKRTSRIVLSSVVSKGDLSLETSIRVLDGLARTNFWFGQVGLDLT